MKSFKNFLTENLLLEKEFSNIKLYHGHPTYEKSFDTFRDKMTFFSDTPKFASEYAEQKAFEQKPDADLYLYECTFSGKLFYIWNMNERQLLYNNLPDKFKINFSFFDNDIDKTDAIEYMRARGDKHTYDEAAKKEVGETFSKDAPNDKYMIVKKEADKVYAIQIDSFNTVLKSLFSHYDDYRYSNNIKLRYKDHPIADYFSDLRDEVKELGKAKTVWESFWDLYNTDREKATELNKEAKDILIKALAKYPSSELYVYPFNIKPSKIAIANTWYYFENDTVINTLKKLGYDGYVSREKKHNTYAIFNVNKVKIDSIKKIR